MYVFCEAYITPPPHNIGKIYICCLYIPRPDKALVENGFLVGGTV